jgi:hypothetical protein
LHWLVPHDLGNKLGRLALRESGRACFVAGGVDMAMTCISAAIAATSIATALFSGIVQPGAPGSELLSLALAGLTGITIAGASALDG